MPPVATGDYGGIAVPLRATTEALSIQLLLFVGRLPYAIVKS